jgi:hypothetical protein
MNDGGGIIVLLGFGMKPESIPVFAIVSIINAAHGGKGHKMAEYKPLGILTQGLSNVDCVIVWLTAMKTKLILSPTAAVTDSGEYTRSLPPTVT